MNAGAQDAAGREDNLSLLRRYHAAEDTAERASMRERLVEANAGLVRAVAQRYRDRIRHHSGIEMEDLYQIGTIGMIKAIRSFDFSYDRFINAYFILLAKRFHVIACRITNYIRSAIKRYKRQFLFIY